MSQPTLTTYGGAQRDEGYAGGVIDMNNVDSESLTNDQALAIVPGTFVARSAADNTCKAPTADANMIVGFAMRFPIKAVSGPANSGTSVVAFAQYDSVPVAYAGFFWAIAAENVTRGDAALSLTAGNGTIGGTTGGAAGAGRVAVLGASWESTTTSGNIGRLRLNR